MKKIIKWSLFTILGLALLGAIVFFGIAFYVGNWYAEARAKSRQTTYEPYGSRYAEDSVKRGVFVKKLNFIVETDSLKQYFNEKDTIFYIERGFHEKKWGGTRILTEKETNYPYQLIARDVETENKIFRFEYLKEKSIGIQDSVSGSYYHPKIMLKKIQNDTIFLNVYLREKEAAINSQKKVGLVKIF